MVHERRRRAAERMQEQIRKARENPESGEFEDRLKFTRWRGDEYSCIPLERLKIKNFELKPNI
jgi:hypothetical protein